MKLKIIAATTALALGSWVALASATPILSSAPNQARSFPGYQLAQEDEHEHLGMHPEARHEAREERREAREARHEAREDEWYQGRRGNWYRDGNNWRWRDRDGDEWYQGQRGDWYQEPNGWQFGTAGQICNNQGRNCRYGGYLPPNGEGMVSRTNPGMFWHCDSNGHNCHWARRPF